MLPNIMDYYCNGSRGLYEAEGIFKLEPIRNADPTGIESLGLYKSEALEHIVVNLISTSAFSWMNTPLKVLHECDITSVFLPVGKVPKSYITKAGSSISFLVPPTPGLKICALNICVLYKPSQFYVPYGNGDPNIKMINKSKRIGWRYYPMYHALSTRGIWLSQWNVRGKIYPGDSISLKVDFPFGCSVLLCGIKVVPEVIPFDPRRTVPSEFPWHYTYRGRNFVLFFGCRQVDWICGRTNCLGCELKWNPVEKSWRRPEGEEDHVADLVLNEDQQTVKVVNL
jgi:hypothetical protein